MSDSLKEVLITLPDGQQARLSESDGDKTIIISPVPSPPGSTVRGKIENVAVDFQLKVKSCQKQPDGFAISGRTQNATREMRAALKRES